MNGICLKNLSLFISRVVSRQGKEATLRKTKYANKKPYNNIPLKDGEVLAPFIVTKELMSTGLIIEANIETWKIGKCRFKVAFVPVAEEFFDEFLSDTWHQIHNLISSGGADDLKKECGHLDDLSLDVYPDDLSYSSLSVQAASFEDSSILRMDIEQVIRKIHSYDRISGEILICLCEGRDKDEIIRRLGVSKGYGYRLIKAAQAMARAMYKKGVL